MPAAASNRQTQGTSAVCVGDISRVLSCDVLRPASCLLPHRVSEASCSHRTGIVAARKESCVTVLELFFFFFFFFFLANLDSSILSFSHLCFPFSSGGLFLRSCLGPACKPGTHTKVPPDGHDQDPNQSQGNMRRRSPGGRRGRKSLVDINCICLSRSGGRQHASEPITVRNLNRGGSLYMERGPSFLPGCWSLRG